MRKDCEVRVVHVTLKSFGPRLVQQACERLYDHLNSLAPVMHCEDGDYTLYYACQPRPTGLLERERGTGSQISYIILRDSQCDFSFWSGAGVYNLCGLLR